MLTVVTCTGDRPDQFRQCEAYMARQTLRNFRWIMVDDGLEPTVTTMGQTVIRRPPAESVVASFCGNLVAGLEAVETPLVAIVEDDDWYAPEWLNACVAGLRAECLFGEAFARYFNLRDNRHHTFKNAERASLCATAFRRDVRDVILPYLRSRRGTGADLHLWRNVESRVAVPTQMTVGLKGYPTGRQGAASGHRHHPEWKHDPERKVLRSWIGEDASRYEAGGS